MYLCWPRAPGMQAANLELAVGIARALAHLHSKSIVHGGAWAGTGSAALACVFWLG